MHNLRIVSAPGHQSEWHSMGVRSETRWSIQSQAGGARIQRPFQDAEWRRFVNRTLRRELDYSAVHHQSVPLENTPAGFQKYVPPIGNQPRSVCEATTGVSGDEQRQTTRMVTLYIVIWAAKQWKSLK